MIFELKNIKKKFYHKNFNDKKLYKFNFAK